MYSLIPSGHKLLTQKQFLKKFLGLFSHTERQGLEYSIEFASRSVYGCYKAIIKGWPVWAQCEKEPRNLDSGKHYFTIYFLGIDRNGNPYKDKVWAGSDLIAKKIYQDINNRDTNMWRYIFGSGAIGMNRKLDATDGFFSIIKSLTNVYCQL